MLYQQSVSMFVVKFVVLTKRRSILSTHLKSLYPQPAQNLPAEVQP